MRDRLAVVFSVSPVLALLVAGWTWPAAGVDRADRPGNATISIVGTTDLHGRIFPERGRGGLELLGGFLANLRAARAADGGALLLIDTGDAFQGGIESNLSEGAVVVDAYNALGYTAAAVGNHEFEFGDVDRWDARDAPSTDPRGALKARAAQARFPFLAANLLDARTGQPVEWPNVRPSVIVDAAGIPVGIVGVMTLYGLSQTLQANVGGLSVAPLATTIEAEASKLRAGGAKVVVVAAHAGGSCATLTTPTDLSSCDLTSEIVEVVEHLPRGLVDVVVAGHTHAAMAHEVAGVAIVQAFSWGRAFSRVDVTLDRSTDRVTHVRIHEPQEVCAELDPTTGACAADTGRADASRAAVTRTPAVPTRYEGQLVRPDGAIAAAMAPALQRVRDLRATPIGPVVDSPIGRTTGGESAIANLFADALRDVVPETDAAISYSAGPGGLRADLATGPLTIGALYDVFPFDNRVVHLKVTGAQLRQVIATQLQRPRGRARALGVSGLRVQVACDASGLRVAVARASGDAIGDGERVTIATMDFLAARAAAVGVTTATGTDSLLLREAVATWLQRRGGHLREAAFADPARPRWTYTGANGVDRCAPA
jgi:2',3'-cyclic-nucleotide 2'-phosphodiesterase (5'-nucleotidase family)